MDSLGSDAQTINYQDEISKMMYGFGDGPRPMFDTVLLIESIVLQQLKTLLKEAHQVSVERGKNFITNYELIYLIHKDKNVLKLKRLHDFQLAQDEIEKIDKFAVLEEFTDEELDVAKKPCAKRRKRTHIEVIQELDTDGEVKNINFDYIGQLRKVRAKNTADSMASDEYETFQEARCASFRPNSDRNFTKFKQWVNPKNEFAITHSGLEVLSFIAYETVADIIDAVLLIRQKSKAPPRYSPRTLLPNGAYFCLQWAVEVMEVHEALTKYFTPKVWLNITYYRTLGLEYLFDKD